MSRVAVFVVNVADHTLLLPLAQGLDHIPGVVSWQAVDGQANLVVTITGSSDPFLEHLNREAGQQSVTMCEVISPISNGNRLTLPGDRCHAWVFTDVEATKADSVRERLAAVGGVTLILETRGGCDFIALVSGSSLDELDRIISREIQPLDGLLRLKRHRIITLTGL